MKHVIQPLAWGLALASILATASSLALDMAIVPGATVTPAYAPGLGQLPTPSEQAAQAAATSQTAEATVVAQR